MTAVFAQTGDATTEPAGPSVAYDPEVASTFRTYCGNCDAPVNAEEIYGPELSGSHPQHTRWLVCPVCTNGILHLESGQIYPPVMMGRAVEGLPPEVDAAWRECRSTFGAGAYTATELMCRKILMHIAVDTLGMKPGQQFLTYVDEMEKQSYIAAGLKPAVDKIRQRGNFATHQIPPSSKEDAERTMRITHHLLSGTYEIAGL